MPGIQPTVLPYLHQIPLPTPFAVGDVNVYLLEGEQLTLLDCGVNSTASLDHLRAALKERGYVLEDIERLILSHHHVDHLGAVQQLAEISAAEIIAHPYTVPFVEMPHAVHERARSFVEAAFNQTAVPQHIIDLIEEQDQHLEAMLGTAVVGRTLNEGDTIELGTDEWTAYHTPGHAGGMICLFEPKSGILLSSDHILAHISSNPLMEAPDAGQKRPRRLLEYIYHMKRMAALNPTIAYTGHGAPAHELNELVQKRVEHHELRAEKLLNLFSGQPRKLYELVQLLFPHKSENESFLTLSEVIGHLDMLEVTGRVVRDLGPDGVIRWKPA